MKNRIHKRKLNKKRFLLSLILLCVVIYLYINSHNISIKSTDFISSLDNHSEYDIIKQDTNPNYAGIGQENISHKDGYFTTQKKIIKKPIWNINKMERLLGVITPIGEILWLKTAVV